MYYGNVSLKLSAKEGAAPSNYLRLQRAIHIQLHLKGKTLHIVPMKPSTSYYANSRTIVCQVERWLSSLSSCTVPLYTKNCFYTLSPAARYFFFVEIRNYSEMRPVVSTIQIDLFIFVTRQIH